MGMADLFSWASLHIEGAILPKVQCSGNRYARSDGTYPANSLSERRGLAGTCFGGTFVVTTAGEAYDADEQDGNSGSD
jgi:hypothetical protein